MWPFSLLRRKPKIEVCCHVDNNSTSMSINNASVIGVSLEYGDRPVPVFSWKRQCTKCGVAFDVYGIIRDRLKWRERVKVDKKGWPIDDDENRYEVVTGLDFKQNPSSL